MEHYNYTIVNGKQVPLRYSIPSNILRRFTGEFLDIFNTELLQCFWNESFSKACEKLGMDDVLKYYKGLERNDSIIFDKELCRLLQRWEKRK